MIEIAIPKGTLFFADAPSHSPARSKGLVYAQRNIKETGHLILRRHNQTAMIPADNPCLLAALKQHFGDCIAEEMGTGEKKMVLLTDIAMWGTQQGGYKYARMIDVKKPKA